MSPNPLQRRTCSPAARCVNGRVAWSQRLQDMPRYSDPVSDLQDKEYNGQVYKGLMAPLICPNEHYLFHYLESTTQEFLSKLTKVLLICHAIQLLPLTNLATFLLLS